jgi:outer membrane protein
MRITNRFCTFTYRHALFILYVLSCEVVHAQSLSDTLVHLTDVLQLAEQRYPLITSRRLEVQASQKNTEVIKYSRAPTIDASYQANISTANNLTGQFYPYGILPMTGPVSASNIYTAATGSAASLLLNWQAITFGMRDAQIHSSIALTGTQSASLKQDIFNQNISLISIYLDLIFAYDIVRVSEHNLERVKENLRQSIELTTSGIKPGVDSALFLSEVSRAKIEWMNAKKNLETQQLTLAQFLLIRSLPAPADTAFLHRIPNVSLPADTGFSKHPSVLFAQSQLAYDRSKEDVLKKSFLPKLSLYGTAFARGSGFENNGNIKTWDGMSLSRYNYGAGLQLSFPIMKYGEVKRQLSEQNLLSQASEERIVNTENNLYYQQQINITALNNGVAVARESELQLASASYAFDAMDTRYTSGLVNFSDLIQAQYNLYKAELDLKRAYWDVWKGLLLQAAVKGDENIFLQQIK